MGNYYEIEPEESRFYTIGIDLTHKCNMECANCYSPERNKPEFTTADVKAFLARLKNKTEIRFTGGEPTLRPDLGELIAEAKRLGHRPALMTNGLKLANLKYTQQLKDHGLRFVCLSMNGGTDDEVYKLMDGVACAEKKNMALENMARVGFFANINCIIARGINEHVPLQLVQKMRELSLSGTIRLRNIGQIGRHMSGDNYTFTELLSLVPKWLGIPSPNYDEYRRVNGYEEAHNVLFPVDGARKYRGIWIKITDWAPPGSSIPDPGSTRRGRLTQSLRVAPFFEDVEKLGY